MPHTAQNISSKILDVLELYAIDPVDLVFMIIKDCLANHTREESRMKSLLKKLTKTTNFLKFKTRDMANLSRELSDFIVNNFDMMILEEEFPHFPYQAGDEEVFLEEVVRNLDNFRTIKRAMPTRFFNLIYSLKSIERVFLLVNLDPRAKHLAFDAIGTLLNQDVGQYLS